MSIYGVNTGTLIALGKQWIFGIVTFVCLWLVALPAIYFYAIKENGGIDSLWKCLNPPYIILNAILCAIIFSTDWSQMSCNVNIKRDDSRCIEDITYGSVG